MRSVCKARARGSYVPFKERDEKKNEVISNLEEAGNKRQRRPSTPTRTHSNGLFRIRRFVHLRFSRHLITCKLLTEKPSPDAIWSQHENKCLSGNFSGRAGTSPLTLARSAAGPQLFVQVWSFSHSKHGCPEERSLLHPPP